MRKRGREWLRKGAKKCEGEESLREVRERGECEGECE